MVVGFLTTYATSAYNWVRIPHRRGVFALYDKVCQWLAAGRWFPPQIKQTAAVHSWTTVESGVRHLIPNHNPTFAMAKQVHDLFELKL